MLSIKRLRAAKALFFLFTLCVCACSDPHAGKTPGKNAKTPAPAEDPQPAPAAQNYRPDAVKIVVSTPPQKYLVQRLAGDHAYVVSLLGEHDDFLKTEHVSDEKLAELADAKLFFKCGAPVEKSVKVPPTCKTYNMMKDLKLRPFASHTQYLNGGKSFVNDPYIWLAPGKAVKMLPEVYQGLRAVCDERWYGEFTQNFTRFTRELNSLEGDIQRILLDSLSRDILVAEPVLGYFCDDFGLKQFSYDFTPANAADEFMRTTIENKIRVVLFSPVAPANIDGRTANLLGGTVETINPMAENYTENLLRIASAIAGRRYETQ